jgi:hypothetical protein
MQANHIFHIYYEKISQNPLWQNILKELQQNVIMQRESYNTTSYEVSSLYVMEMLKSCFS